MRGLLACALMVMCLVCACPAESFRLKQDETGKLYGPFDFHTGATVTVSGASFALVMESSDNREMQGILQRAVVIPETDFSHASLQNALNFVGTVLKSNSKGKGIGTLIRTPKKRSAQILMTIHLQILTWI